MATVTLRTPARSRPHPHVQAGYTDVRVSGSLFEDSFSLNRQVAKKNPPQEVVMKSNVKTGRTARLGALALLLAIASPSIATAADEPATELGAAKHFDALEAGQSLIESAFAASRAPNLHTVDPESLNPPAEIEFVPWFG